MNIATPQLLSASAHALALGGQLVRIYVEAAGAADTILTGSVAVYQTLTIRQGTGKH